MRTKSWFFAVIASAGLLAAPSTGQGEPGSIKAFMRPKLDYAQKVLAGLTLEDFDLVVKSARAMRGLSEAAEWQFLPGLEYTRHSGEFQRLTNELIRTGTEKNLDGATLAYVQLTMNCVNCHRHVRDAGKRPRQ